MYYLGVIGDMRKTRYILIDENFDKILDLERVTIHIHHIGINNLKIELMQAVNDVIVKAEIKRKDIGFIFLGLQGYGESEKNKKIIEEIVHEALSEFKYAIDNDSIAGWAAGTLCRSGINVVSGTGSVVFGMNEKGESGRAGGWGPVIGDDGSAQWIGIRLVNEYTKQKDGRKKETRLIEILEKDTGIEDYYGVVDLIFNKYNLSMIEFTKLCDIGILAADEGCEASKQIFKEAAFEIFLLIKSLKERLSMDYKFIISYTDGAFRAGRYILEPLELFLKEANIECDIQKAPLEKALGACLMAYKLYGNDIEVNTILKKNRS